MKDYDLLISNRNIQIWFHPERSIIRVLTYDALTASRAIVKLLCDNIIPSIEGIVISDEPYSTLVIMIRGNQIARFLRKSSDEEKEEQRKSFSSFLEKTGEL